MPCMPRPQGPKLMRKGMAIAFHILGVPPNMKKQKKSPHDIMVEKQLRCDETYRVR